MAVSYTHLDVYKRQDLCGRPGPAYGGDERNLRDLCDIAGACKESGYQRILGR